MKPGFAFVTVLAGLGGWLYVQLALYPVDRRWDEFKRLPGVEHVVEWNDMRAIKAEFEGTEDGSVSLMRHGETITWNSFEEWKADFQAYDRSALFWYNKTKNAEAFAKLERDADNGSFDALRILSLIGVDQTSQGTDVLSSLQNGTAAGAWLSGLKENGDQRIAYMQSREGMLTYARMMQENLRWAGMSDDEYDQQTRKNERALSVLQQQAEAGDSDAKWIWGRLHGDTTVRIPVSN